MADTSPLNYLVLLGLEHVLPAIYRKILVPPAVLSELGHPGAPSKVRDFANDPPGWIEDSSAFPIDMSLPTVLGAGEREAISLALHLSATFVLLDDGAARKAAKLRSLVPAGTLAVLLQASRRGLVNLPSEVHRLTELGFRVSEELLTEYGKRKM